MVGNARFVNINLLTRKLGATEINIVPNIFVRLVFPKYGFKWHVCTTQQGRARGTRNRKEEVSVNV